MYIEQLMKPPIFDGLADWLDYEAAHTDRAYLWDKFTRWATEVRAVQAATKRVEDEE